jgi:hypothetical protein
MVVALSSFEILLCLTFTCSFRRKRPAAKEPVSKRAKASPVIIPPTTDAPIPSPIRDNAMDNKFEQDDDQSAMTPEANPTTQATAKDVIQSHQASGSSCGPEVDMAGADSYGRFYWKK